MVMFEDDLWNEFDDWEDEPIVLTKCELIHSTAKAYLIRVPTIRGYKEAWFPKSYSRFHESTDLTPNYFEYADWLTVSWSHHNW